MDIIVNGKRETVAEPSVTFEEVSVFACGKVRDGLSVTWRAGKAGGMLSAGQSVGVVEGMVFNAVVTGGA